MTKLAIIGSTLAAAALICATALPAHAEDRPADKPTTAADAPAPKKEAKDAMPVGTKGVSTGTIVSLEKGKLVLHTGDGDLLFMPNWHGGMPKDGGGLDKAILAKLDGFKAGDSVRIEWTWSERRRIESIAAANAK